jgi:hypothetical protein
VKPKSAIVRRSASDVINKLSQAVVNAFIIRETFMALYDGEKAELLIDSDEQFFGLTYLTLLDAICLSLTKLLDPALSNGNENLTFDLLLDHTELAEATDHAKWKRELERIKVAAKKLTHLRNKVVAHSDYAHFTARDVSEHPGFSRAGAEEVHKRMGDLLNDCRNSVNLTPMIYEFVADFGYARKLISRLEIAREYFRNSPKQ